MKRILNFPVLGLVLLAALFLYSCESDPVDPPVNVPPVVTLTSSADLTVAPGETFTITFSASKGSDSPLKAVTVYEDGTKVPTSRMTINGAAAAANAILITGAEVDGITWTIDIVAQTSAATIVAFEVEVQDEAGGKNSVFVNVTTVGTPPTLTATPPTTFEVEEGSTNDFKLTGVKGTGDLVSIEVLENNIKVDASRLEWDGQSMVGMDNPFPLSADEIGGFDETRLRLDLPMSVGTWVYTMILTDEFSLTSSVEYTVTTTSSGTPIDLRADVVLDSLTNAGGPQGTGGLDLDNGQTTNSNDPNAEIKDNGLDNTLPPGDNWLMTISPITENGVSMKYLVAGQGGLSENFTFEGIEFKEDLPGLFANGVDLVNDVSNVVNILDVFIVERDGNYWVLEVVETSSDPNNNDDFYRFDVKY